MSLDSSLYLDTTAMPLALCDVLIATGHFQRARDGGATVIADGVIVTVGAPAYQDRPQLVGIKATQHLFFACTSNEETEAWTRHTLRAVMALLHALPGDMLFYYSSDYPALLRKNGVLTLDDRISIWKSDAEPPLLPMIDVPYVWATLPRD